MKALRVKVFIITFALQLALPVQCEVNVSNKHFLRHYCSWITYLILCVLRFVKSTHGLAVYLLNCCKKLWESLKVLLKSSVSQFKSSVAQFTFGDLIAIEMDSVGNPPMPVYVHWALYVGNNTVQGLENKKKHEDIFHIYGNLTFLRLQN